IRPRVEAQLGVGREIFWEEMLCAQASGIIGYRAAVHQNGWPKRRTEQRLHLRRLTIPGNAQADRPGAPPAVPREQGLALCNGPTALRGIAPGRRSEHGQDHPGLLLDGSGCCLLRLPGHSAPPGAVLPGKGAVLRLLTE